MTHLNVGHSGVKVQSFADANPRALLFRLASGHPNASEQELLDLCLVEIEAHPEFIEAIVEYWFANNYRMLRWKNNDKREAPSREMIENIKAQMRLLDWVMPNGKTLGQSTGTECVKAGGWLADIGKKAGERIVSTVFSERELRDMLKEHA